MTISSPRSVCRLLMEFEHDGRGSSIMFRPQMTDRQTLIIFAELVLYTFNQRNC